MTTPAAPAGTGPTGRRLWRSVLSEFVLAEHELTLLRRAVAVADACESLQGTVKLDGLMIESDDDPPRGHPASVELRQQRILLARLIVALRVPLDEDAEQSRTQRRGVRGFYSVRGGAA